MMLHQHRRPRWQSKRRWSCERKRRYGRHEAHRLAAMSSERSGRRIRAYHCEWCGSYHIGKKESWTS